MDQPVNTTEALEVIIAIREEVSKVVIGQLPLLEKLLNAVLADGHVLLEGAPGLAIRCLKMASSEHFWCP